MEIVSQALGGARLLERTFHVAKKNAGFLGLGVLIQVMVNGKPIDDIVVYGDTLHAIKRHVDAQVSGDPIKIVTTNKVLPKRLQYPTDASIK
ncbi:MAG: hypothetical protein ACD_12C00793G0002 [uncultured bacterium]|nr:MAG: hypothetical protein ACD_12C00793G0002 [uncultured bacterium]